MEVRFTVYPNYIPFIRDYYPELQAINAIGEQSSMGIDVVLSHRGSLIVMDGLWTKDSEIVMYTDWRDERQGRVNNLQEAPKVSLPKRRGKKSQNDQRATIPVQAMDDAIFPTNARENAPQDESDPIQDDMFKNENLAPKTGEQLGINQQIGRNK